ncbi:MAG: Dabb family protein [Bacteroidota bacterium]
MRILFSCFLFLTFVGCSNTADQTRQLEQLQAKVDRLEQLLLTYQTNEDQKGELVHVVWFSIKEGISTSDMKPFVDAVKNLGNIKQVKNLRYGKFEDLGDTRALSDYEFVMEMTFQNREYYAQYQAHPIHLELKQVAGNYVDAAPATYDYTID